MRHIMVLNAKGGCGKSTIATNLASYYATQDKKVALVDYDPQRSALDWLAKRPADRPPIEAVEGFTHGLRNLPRSVEVAVIDAPARVHGPELTNLVRHAETIVVPVLPSTIDIQAASRFLEDLKTVGRVERREVRIAVVANRMRENTLIAGELDEYLDNLRTPYVAKLREAQNYIRAYTRGLGIFELPEYLAWPDWEQWEPLVEWLGSRRSRPVAA
ncbi:MAG: ParA family protein [Gammaproteobacteria bacterium]|nr:MAG: ParA family protein [Gammaproteobacteria bacterium]